MKFKVIVKTNSESLPIATLPIDADSWKDMIEIVHITSDDNDIISIELVNKDTEMTKLESAEALIEHYGDCTMVQGIHCHNCFLGTQDGLHCKAHDDSGQDNDDKIWELAHEYVKEIIKNV